MERFEPERSGSMLEEFDQKNGRGSLGKIFRSSKAKKRPSEVGVPPWDGGGCATTGNTEEVSGEKIGGHEFSLFEEYNLQRLQCKQEESKKE